MKGGMGNGLELMLDIQQDEYLPVWGETGKPKEEGLKPKHIILLTFACKCGPFSFHQSSGAVGHEFVHLDTDYDFGSFFSIKVFLLFLCGNTDFFFWLAGESLKCLFREK